MSKERVHVIIDVNEPGEVTAAIDSHEDVESYELARLPAADLEIEGIGFERKTLADYSTSLTGKRLTEQTIKLKQRYEYAYILLEGDLSNTMSPWRESNISPESLRGSMASLTAREGLPVIPCSNLSLLADMAVRLARKHLEETDRKFIPRGAVGPDEPVAKMMYGCIEGVGADTAETLYEAYPSVVELLNAGVDELQELDGIGEKTAQTIQEALL